MPKLNKKSLWRADKCKFYQADFLKELVKIQQPKQMFMVKDVWHKISCLKHLSDSYAYDIAIAVCVQAAHDGVLERLGKFYYLKESK